MRLPLLVIVISACTATRSFNGVTGTGPNDVWVAGGSVGAEGGSSLPIAYHWNGDSWSHQEGVPGGALSGVWVSPTDVWFAGDSTLRWNGTTWTDLGALGDTRSVWGDGAGTVWAVGLGGRALRFDAAGAQMSSETPTSQPLFGVWGSSASDVWAVGLGGTMLHWQGTSWTASTIPVSTSSLNAISGNASHDVWSVGDEGTIVHWDGSAWTSVASGTTMALEGVWANGSSDAWAVGGRETGGGRGIVLHFDGTSWSQAYSGGSRLIAVWGTSASDVWAVGEDLTIAHWNGTKWTSTQLAP